MSILFIPAYPDKYFIQINVSVNNKNSFRQQKYCGLISLHKQLEPIGLWLIIY